jgi:hypothetical protein
VAVDSPATTTTPITLDGAEATLVSIGPPDTFAGRNGPGAGSDPVKSVVLFHDGRAIVIGWISGNAAPGYFGDLLETLRFVD